MVFVSFSLSPCRVSILLNLASFQSDTAIAVSAAVLIAHCRLCSLPFVCDWPSPILQSYSSDSECMASRLRCAVLRRCIHCSVLDCALCSLSVGVPSGSDLHGVGSGSAIPSTDVWYGVVLYLGIASPMRYLLLSTYVCSVLAECGCPFGK